MLRRGRMKLSVSETAPQRNLPPHSPEPRDTEEFIDYKAPAFLWHGKEAMTALGFTPAVQISVEAGMD